jgi:hypothetical protein
MTALGGGLGTTTADNFGPPLGFGGGPPPPLGPLGGGGGGPRRTGPSGCALIIPGPGKSSLFDHTNQLFGGRQAGFEASSTCITYEV